MAKQCSTLAKLTWSCMNISYSKRIAYTVDVACETSVESKVSQIAFDKHCGLLS